MKYYFYSETTHESREEARRSAVGAEGVQNLCQRWQVLGFGEIYLITPNGKEFALSDFECEDFAQGRFTAECSHCGELAYVDHYATETVERCGKCHKYDMDHYDDSMDGDHESALASAGFGTDEDYGYYGD